MPENLLKNQYVELKDKLVLNVDDNEMNHLVLSKLLEKVGLKIISARTGAAAVTKLKEGLKPDAILMDIEMPGMNGIEASEIIKKKIDSHIPIIINSGNVDALDRWKLSRLGITDFLEKPYSLTDIFSKLKKSMHIHLA